MSLTSEQVKKLRKQTGLTQTEAAHVVRVTMRAWQNWESPASSSNARQMPDGYVELFCLKQKLPYPPDV